MSDLCDAANLKIARPSQTAVVGLRRLAGWGVMLGMHRPSWKATAAMVLCIAAVVAPGELAG